MNGKSGGLMVMRPSWRKTEPQSTLPAGDGTWKAPAVTVAN